MSKDLKNKIVSCGHQKLEMVCGHKETQRLNTSVVFINVVQGYLTPILPGKQLLCCLFWYVVTRKQSYSHKIFKYIDRLILQNRRQFCHNQNSLPSCSDILCFPLNIRRLSLSSTTQILYIGNEKARKRIFFTFSNESKTIMLNSLPSHPPLFHCTVACKSSCCFVCWE